MPVVAIERSGTESLEWDQLVEVLRDPMKRICSGALYKIKVKVAEAKRFEGVGGGGADKTKSEVEESIAATRTPIIFENGDISPTSSPGSGFSGIPSRDKQLEEKIAATAGELEPDYGPLGEHVEDEDDAAVVPFRPNRAQRRWIERMWTRNLILKARQLGFTTLIAIIWLDHALFNANQYCGMIAQDRETAERIFKDKILLAYQHLPDVLRERMPLKACSASEVHFAHNDSKIRVATSVRAGTVDRLHVSEFGKISARDPKKAAEVVTGSFPAVPTDGIIVVESTAEGQQGEFFKMVQRAINHVNAGIKLNKKQYRLQFFAWWKEPSYALPYSGERFTPEDLAYFAEIEGAIRQPLSNEQRLWWVTTRDDEFSGDDEKMWQEYPSTPAEAFKVSTEGVYYAKQLTALRKSRRIGTFPYLPHVPVDTYWDLGSGDGTGVWLGQDVEGVTRFFRYIEGWGEPYAFYIKELREATNDTAIWRRHKLPHDAQHKRQQATKVTSPEEELKAMSLGGRWECVDKVDDITHGIQLTRQCLASACFDEAGCSKGLTHLWNYRKKWNKATAAWAREPDKAGGHSEAADSLRQWAQAGGTLGGGAANGLSHESLARFKRRRRNR